MYIFNHSEKRRERCHAFFYSRHQDKTRACSLGLFHSERESTLIQELLGERIQTRSIYEKGCHLEYCFDKVDMSLKGNRKSFGSDVTVIELLHMQDPYFLKKTKPNRNNQKLKFRYWSKVVHDQRYLVFWSYFSYISTALVTSSVTTPSISRLMHQSMPFSVLTVQENI